MAKFIRKEEEEILDEWTDLEFLQNLAEALNFKLGLEPPIEIDDREFKYLKKDIIEAINLLV